MTTKVIFTCDRCGKSGSGEIVELRGVFLRIGSNLHDYGGAQMHQTLRAEWCDECVRHLGIWPPSPSFPPPQDPPPTLEDIVRQIVREEVPCPTS